MTFFLHFHGFWRWLLLIAAALVTLKALIGWLGKQRFIPFDDRLGLVFTIIVDIQFLFGLILWLFGPINVNMLAQAMGNPGLRFILLEHGILSLIALVFAHIGRTRAKRAVSDAAKHRVSFIFYLLSLAFLGLIFLLPRMMG